VRGRSRRRGLRARRPGGGSRPVRHPRRDPRPLPGDVGPRRARRPVRHRGRVAARVLTFTQRSFGDVDRVEVAPAAELAAEHRELAEVTAAGAEDEDRPDIADVLPVDRFHAFLDLAPADASVVIAAEEDVAPALRDHWQDVCAAFHDADAHHLYVKPDDIHAALDARAKVQLSSISGDQPLQFRAQTADTAARSLKEAETELEKLTRSQYRTVVAWGTRAEGERAAYNLARVKATWDTTGPLRFVHARLRDGFIAPGIKLAVLPDHRLLRRRRAERTGGMDAGRRRRGTLRSFADLRTGDIIVHEDHGLARFAGFDTKTVGGVTRDYLNLEYAGTDKVFLPVDQLAKISRYVGAGGSHPPLSKLGGKSWEAMKTRARRAAQELAGELLNLYAERKRRTGFGFPEDSEWLQEFEAKFPYQETPDQREAIELVKVDMEAERPMDRLICGDVGYGKTEVALRAAFKAADAGKQVLVLVPTTILAQQHYGTFAERLKDYPFTIEHVSRFRPAREQKLAIEGFGKRRGRHPHRHPPPAQPRRARQGPRADHRRRGAALRRQAEGAAAPDEAQGRRDRHERDADPAHAADVDGRPARHHGHRDAARGPPPDQDLRRRVRRGARQDGPAAREGAGGQAFFLHNRVETIDETAERLRGLCPDMSFEVAHGQLDEQALEKRMLSFLRGDADVLVATSIIESGIDIPQANTLIVERSDMFGLSQLYQIRGRVGRSRERAFAYLLYPSAAALTPDAANRLSALSDYTELGAGFKVAMRDLELRGAGNLLGDEQSGHVAALGFELYMQMLDEAIQEREGKAEDEREPVRLDINVDAYVPADYVPYEQAKVDVHRRIAGAYEVSDLEALRSELEDRFGPVPEPLANLLALQRARIKLGQAGATTVSFRGNRLAVTPVELDSVRARKLREEIPEAMYESGKSQVSVRVPDDPEQRFPAVVRAADVLLAVTSAAA
jgi:transcription-repair coupling factor (superfamily II helicase)